MFRNRWMMVLWLGCLLACVFSPRPVAAAKKRCVPAWRQRFKRDFRKETLLEVVKWVASKTCYNFLLNDRVKNLKVTMIVERSMRMRSYYQAFLTMLEVNGITIIRTGGYRKLIYSRNAPRRPVRTYVKGRFRHPKREEVVTYLLRIKHLDANRLLSLVRQLSSSSGRQILIQSSNALLLVDYATRIHRIIKILKKIDVEKSSVQDKLYMIQIENGQAQEIVQRLRAVFQIIPRSRLQRYRRSYQIDERHRISKILADDRTNRIIIMCSKRAYQNALGLVQKLDIPLADGGKIRVHHLRYAKAEEVAQTLSQLAQGRRPTRRVRRRGKKPARSASPSAADLFQGEVRITADRGTNSLVIVSNQRDYENLMRVIRRLDLRRKQVFLEAVILEISLDKARDLGAVFHGGVPLSSDTQNPEFAIFGTQLSGVNSLIFDPAALMGLALGIRGPAITGSAGFLGPNTPEIPSFGVLIRALQSNTDVDIISTPHILTATNEEATIQVGQNVPFIAGTSFSAGVGVSFPVRNIQRQDVALTMKLKPQINHGDRVKIELDLEITEIAGQNPDLGPTTTKRKVKTTVRVKDNQTVVIGGLMRDKVSNGISKVPVLGDIPLLGALFRMTNKKVEKQNLLIFITPHIVLHPADFRRLFVRKMKERQDFLRNFYARKYRKTEKYSKTRLSSGVIDSMIQNSKTKKNKPPPR